MFVFLSKPELLQLHNKYPDDTIVMVDSSIKREKDLRYLINRAIESPYGNEDNWDGIYEALGDLDWWTEKTIRIVHLELPDITESEIETYLSVLYDNDSFWEDLIMKNVVTTKQVFVYFRTGLKNKMMKMCDSITKKRQDQDNHS